MAKPNKKPKSKVEKPVNLAILTGYLFKTAEEMKTGCTCGNCSADEQLRKQIENNGYDPNNFSNIRSLNTARGRRVDININERRENFNPSNADLAIAGSTEYREAQVESLKGSGLIVARYSKFYGGRSGYTGNTAAEGGYSLDLPKQVSVVKRILTRDNFLESILSRDERKIVDAVKKVNKGLSQPIIVTPYLKEAISKKNTSENGIDNKTYNVLCVTKRPSDRFESGPFEWHLPITGIARLLGSEEILLGEVQNSLTRVEFNGNSGRLLYARPGLNGTALTIAMESRIDGRTWELYTDTPVEKKYTPDKIREIAEKTIARNMERFY